MKNEPEPNRRYIIEVKDVQTGEKLMLAAADWTDTEKRIALAQITRLAEAPADNCFAALITSGDEPKAY